MSAYGYDRVACALLTHRAPSPAMLAAALRRESRRLAAEEYCGNLLWRLMMHEYPASQVPSFSQYMRSLDHPAPEKSGREILEDLKEKLRKRRGGETT